MASSLPPTRRTVGRYGWRALAGASALLLLPAAVPLAAADPGDLTDLRERARLELPEGVRPAASIGAAGTARRGPVDVMLQLDVRPAAAAYAAGLERSDEAAAAASTAQTDRVRAAQARVTAALRVPATRGTELYRTSALYAGVAVRTDASRLPALAALPGVKAIRPLTPKAPSNAVTVPLTGAPESWQATGQTGEGVRVGIIDTGIDFTHSDFGGPGTVEAYDEAFAVSDKKPTYPDPVKVAGGYDFAGNDYNADPDSPSYQPVPVPDPNPLDCDGHGSHVAGTTAGYGVNPDGSTYGGEYDTDTDFAGMRIGPGMAPGATLYGLKVFGCEGSTSVVADALDWAADPNGDGDLSDHLDVVNMSLGSSFGSPEDPDSVATDNAVLAGISVVASIGNSGDLFEAGGSPGDAVRSIAVAATDDPVDVYDGLAWSVDGEEQENLVAQRSVAYDWANEPPVDGTLVTIGDWTQPPSETNNTDGCDPLSPADVAVVDGSIPLLYWTSDDSARRCGSAGRSGNVRTAGAIGAVLGNDVRRFTSGITGDAVIPVMQVNADGTEDLLASVEASPGDVEVLLTNDLRNSETIVSSGPQDPTDQIADFSSRGTTAGSSVKPDVSAPGVSIFSAAVGTGFEGLSESGTSMAAPHTAGLAALVLDRRPGWTPEQVKAAIMGTADHEVYAEPGQAGQALGLLRAGTGRIDARAAVAAQTLAYEAGGTGSVSVSFGVVDVTKKTTLTKQVTVENTRATATAQYTVGIDGIDALPGASWSVSPAAVSIPAGGTATLTVSLTLDPKQLTHKPEPSLQLDPLGLESPAFYRQWLSVTDGLVVLSPVSGTSGGPVHVGVFAAPRPASTMSSTSDSVVVKGKNADKSGTITLEGKGVAVDDPEFPEYSTVSGVQLAATSPELPACSATVVEGCVPFADVAAADLQHVGAASSAPLYADPSDGLVYFAVTSHGSWRTSADIAEFDVLFDITGDGVPDAATYNTRLDGTDVMVAVTVDLETFDTVDIELVNDFGGGLDTAVLHGDVMLMPVWLGALEDFYGMTFDESSVISYAVESYTAYVSGPVDVVGEDEGLDLAITPLAPAYAVTGAFGVTLNDDQPGETLAVDTTQASKKTDAPQGILLLHHLNATGDRAEVLSVQRQSKVALSVVPTSLAAGQRAKATVTVTIPGTSATPGGEVTIKDGSKVLAKGTLKKNGTITVTLPVLKAGSHQLVADYAGTAKVAGATSSAVTVRAQG